jgi:predicted GIY-YIG superfamily endonuclease
LWLGIDGVEGSPRTGKPSREEALAAEMQIKGWTRSKKEAWTANNFEALKRLSQKPPKSN